MKDHPCDANNFMALDSTSLQFASSIYVVCKCMKGYEIGKFQWICIVLKFYMDNPVGIITQPSRLIINEDRHSNTTTA